MIDWLERVFVGEELLGGLGGEHREVLVFLVVGGGQEPPFLHLEQVEVGVVFGGADHAAVEVVAAAADLLADLPDRQHLADGGDRLDDPVEVAVFQPVVQDHRAAGCRPRPAASSLGLTERMMMLVAPRARICSRATRLVPSAIASIEMTAATPKTMPSTVRPDRSLCKQQALHSQRKRSPDASHGYLFSVSVLRSMV